MINRVPSIWKGMNDLLTFASKKNGKFFLILQVASIFKNLMLHHF